MSEFLEQMTIDEIFAIGNARAERARQLSPASSPPSIYEQSRRQPNYSKVISEGMDPAIFYKLDWLSMVYSHCSAFDILQTIFPDAEILDLQTIYDNYVMRNYGYMTDFFLSHEGITLAFHYSEVLDKLGSLDPDTSISFFDILFDYIRVDISGKGLDFLRSSGIDVDNKFRNDSFWTIPHRETCSYHFTRIDTPFDLINYGPDFLDRQIQLCRNLGNPDTLRIALAGKTAGVTYSIREGDQKTLYLGTGRSDKLLRIYDKHMQYRKAGKLGECPYNNFVDDYLRVPESWIRIELQCRRADACSMILFGTTDYKDVFKYICDNFGLRGEDGTLDTSWYQLFDWDVCSNIIQNTKSVQYESTLDRADKYVFNGAWSNIMTVVSHYGWQYLIDKCNKKMLQLQCSNNPIDSKRFASFYLRIMGNDFKLPKFIENNNGILSIRKEDLT